jgi:hypothetical protein
MFGRRLINTGGEVAIPTSFNTVTYTGNGSTQSISGVGFQPDFVWVKSRSAATSHKLTDIVRGTTKALVSNTTAIETTDANGLTAFGSDGFTLGTDSVYNNSSATYVAWCWKAGGAAVTNTDGSITSEVSANVDAGFSVVKYSSSTLYASVGHGLNSAPEIIIMKRYSEAADWLVWTPNLGNGTFLRLNTTGSLSTWGNGTLTPITSTTFTSPDSGSENYIAYCFHSVAGFSKFGSYTGTGATSNSITTGFEPAFVMIKQTSAARNWYIMDNKRNPTNPKNNLLIPNSSGAEFAGAGDTFANFLSTGFDITAIAGDAINQSGQTYIYMAFANQF